MDNTVFTVPQVEPPETESLVDGNIADSRQYCSPSGVPLLTSGWVLVHSVRKFTDVETDCRTDVSALPRIRSPWVDSVQT